MRDRTGGFHGMLSVVCALALALFVMPALAEAGVPGIASGDGLKIEFSINPSEIVGPGDVTMTFVITNEGSADIKNIYLTSDDGLLSEPIGQITAGETQTLVRPHAVTQEELNNGCVRYVLSHDSAIPGGEKVIHTLIAPVARGDVRTDIDFTRQLSSQYVAAGEQLTITYRITNNGNVPVSAIYVRDALGDFTGRLEQLNVGATRTFISRVTINMESQSSASLEYRVPSGETITRRLEPVVIRLSHSVLNSEFSVGRSAFDPERADAVLMLTNVGNDDYSDITVLDDLYGGIIADGVSLPHGGSPVEITFTYPVRNEREYRWRVTGVSQAGEALNFVTETLTLPGEDAPKAVDIRMDIAPRTLRINRPGSVVFDITLANSGTAFARNLRLYDVNRGAARELAVLPTGEPSRFTVSYEVHQDSEFIFCLDYTDPDGHSRTISADPIQITISPSGAAPEPLGSELMQLEGESVKPGNGSTFTILLIVASAALVSMFTILLVTSIRARHDRRLRIAEQKRRIHEELGKTATFTPVKGQPPKKKPSGRQGAKRKQ